MLTGLKGVFIRMLTFFQLFSQPFASFLSLDKNQFEPIYIFHINH